MSSITQKAKPLYTILRSQKPAHVWVSLCNNIYHNLALEDWLYQNMDTEKQNLLMIWRNSPCAVVGRHQNPWAECDISTAHQQGIAIARRNSGGGTVFHDLGNMCLTFFTSRDQYNRADNLNFVASVLRRHWNLKVSLNARDDLVLDGKYKISGTAAKLGGKKSYHHCTLLLSVNSAMLHQVLNTRLVNIESKATESVRSRVKNLQDVNPSVTYEDLTLALTHEYLHNHKIKGEVRYITEPPSEDEFPGISDLAANLADWHWVFGKTPKFTINKTLHTTGTPKLTINMMLFIVKGLISKWDLSMSEYSGPEFGAALQKAMIGIPFQRNCILGALENFITHDMSTEELSTLDTVHQYFDEVL